MFLGFYFCPHSIIPSLETWSTPLGLFTCLDQGLQCIQFGIVTTGLPNTASTMILNNICDLQHFVTNVIRGENCHSFYCALDATVIITVTVVLHLSVLPRLLGWAGNVHSANPARLAGKFDKKSFSYCL